MKKNSAWISGYCIEKLTRGNVILPKYPKSFFNYFDINILPHIEAMYTKCSWRWKKWNICMFLFSFYSRWANWPVKLLTELNNKYQILLQFIIRIHSLKYPIKKIEKKDSKTDRKLYYAINKTSINDWLLNFNNRFRVKNKFAGENTETPKIWN